MAVGDRIADRFLLRAVAGKGGMGTVYRADDCVGGGVVALKLLDAEGAVDAARFSREARVLSELDHPNIVRYMDHGLASEGRSYLAMEWLEGETLAGHLARTRPGVSEAIAVVRGAALGLGAAHDAGVVHRDVKPGNLFLVARDPARVRVLDFGIARAVAAGHTLTASGTVVGTPFYMAPEQARAADGVDARADVYALGAVLYEILTGRPPFRSESLMAVLAAILLEEPVDVRERAPGRGIPDRLAELTSRLLSKEPSTRPVDGRAVAELLARVDTRTGLESVAPPPALTEREQRVLCLVLAAGRFDVLSNAETLQSGGADVVGRLRAAVEAHGGRVEMLADGSLVARMDDEETPADQAVRAAHCALAMREIAPDLGLAIVAGRGQFRGPIPVGEVIQRGTALLSSAVLGAVTLRHGELSSPASREGRLPVRLDEVMVGLVEGRFEVRQGAIGAELGEEIETPSAARRAPAESSPCVGRRRELATLAALYEEASEEPIARVALVTAAAGMGKSRLVAEFLSRARPQRVWHAGGDPVAAGSPFGLVGELVRQACAIREGEPLEERRRKLLAGVGRFVSGPVGQRLAFGLGELARIPCEETRGSQPSDDPKLRGDAMRDAFLTWIGAALERGPLVLVLDDLQWGDRPSLAFVDAALREYADAPLMVIGIGRPELEDHFGDLFAERDVQPIRLARLRPRAAAELVRHGLARRGMAEVEPVVVAELVERADGNPFFLEELVRAVAEGEGEGELPTTVLGMVEARLAVLPGATRRVLRAASVFGRRFWRDGVVELLGGRDRAGDVDEHIAVLERGEIVDAAEPPRFAGHVEYVFRHALTQEAAHAMLTEEDRELGHRLAGVWLEAAGERDALALAEHHAAGGEAMRAAAWLGIAAEQSLQGDELEEAVVRGERALSASPERGPILVTLAEAQRWRGRYAEAFARAEDAVAALRAGSRPWFRALGVLFASAGPQGRFEEAEVWRRGAMEVVAEDGAVGAQVVALCRAATLSLSEDETERFESTMALAERLAASGAADDPLARAWVQTLRASQALRVGDQGAFVEGTEDAVRSYEEAGDLRDACNQRVRLGNAYIGLGDTERAQRVLRQALMASRRMGLSVVEGYALQNLGHALLRGGELAEARAVEERARQLAAALGNAPLEAGCLLYLTEIRHAMGDADAGVRDARRAVELLVDVPGFRAVARAVTARALLASGRSEDALLSAEAAFLELAGASVEEGDALIRLVYSEALTAAGRQSEARQIAVDAAERLERRAARISDRGWRDAFLHRIPHHAALVALAARS